MALTNNGRSVHRDRLVRDHHFARTPFRHQIQLRNRLQSGTVIIAN